uniref:SOCS box domain-containing protein n=1 Tax=Arion vulgaris TaxID=1028688 RepID=A0A0B7APV6_9EUPU
MSSLHLDNNANVSTTTFFRRSPSVDTMLNCDFGSTYKLAQNKEMSSEMSLESLDNVNTPIVSAVIKRSYSKILELDTEASMLNVEPEQLVKLKQPKTREFIEDLCGKIPSLQKLCRRQVHHALRYDGDRAESVKQLPVCHNLQKYIIFELPEQHPYLMQYSNEIIYV